MLSGLRQKLAGLKHQIMTTWFVMRHPATPWWLKVVGILIVAYALSPIDLIPDFLPVLGLLDEMLLLPALTWLVLRSTPPLIRAECQKHADEWLASGNSKPRSKLGAVIVISIWLILGVWIISLIAASPT